MSNGDTVVVWQLGALCARLLFLVCILLHFCARVEFTGSDGLNIRS